MLKRVFEIGRAYSGLKGFLLLGSAVLATITGFVAYSYDQWGIVISILLGLAILVLILAIIFFLSFFYDLLFLSKQYIPVLTVFKKAEKSGWKFKGGNVEILDFILALQQAGYDRTLMYRGKPNASASERIARKLIEKDIPHDHWEDYKIELASIVNFKEGNVSFKEDNFYSHSYSMLKNAKGMEQQNYNDLHVKGINKKWMKDAAKKYKGLSQGIEDKAKKDFERFKTLLLET